MKLSEMKSVLAAREIQLTKSLGQNFLHDGNQLSRIVEEGALTGGDKVLEIGPGLGPLTERLLDRAGEVLAIEKDRRLHDFLLGHYSAALGAGRLHLLHEDALDFLRCQPRDWTGWKMISNLPYSVASPILVELGQAERGPDCMVATLQLEVAQRLMARPGEEDYGLLTVLVRLAYEPRSSFRIPASCFFPAPDVDSACITLVRRPATLLASGQRAVFVKLVKAAFAQRRKMMMKNLKSHWSAERLSSAFRQAGVPADVRAEKVSVAEFAAMARVLSFV